MLKLVHLQLKTKITKYEDTLTIYTLKLIWSFFDGNPVTTRFTMVQNEPRTFVIIK